MDVDVEGMKYLIIRDSHGRVVDFMDTNDPRSEQYPEEEYTKEPTNERYKKKWDKWWKA